MKTIMRVALIAAAAFSLAGCGDKAAKTRTSAATSSVPAAEPSQPLAAILTAETSHKVLAKAAANSGLGAVLEGVGPYTLLAPSDAALNTRTGPDFTNPNLNAEAAALLRAHILPGALTRPDIIAAIDRSAGNGARMRTMAGDLLTFTRNGDVITVTAPDGASARLTGQEVLAANGVFQPLDGLLVKERAVTN